MNPGLQITRPDLAGWPFLLVPKFPNPKKTQVGTSTRGETKGSLPSGYGSSSRVEGNQSGTSGNQSDITLPEKGGEGVGQISPAVKAQIGGGHFSP